MADPLADPRIDWKLLHTYGFDEERFRRCAAAIAAGTLTEASSIIAAERITLPKDEATLTVQADAEARRKDGEAALRRGTVAAVVLNGGMATRFGGVVKGVVEVYDGESFLSLKARDVFRASRLYGVPIPLVLMNSFATSHATHDYVANQQHFGLSSEDLLMFEQSISLRLNTDGSLFIDEDGQPSYHAPGHGDFFKFIRRSGVLELLRERGIETVLFSNVDNLGATIDPLIIGHHLHAGADMTAELTEKRRTVSGEWDKGGAPAYVDGRLQIVEGFRFPPEFPQERLPDFSTNNFLFRAAALDRELDLERHVVRKKVGKQTALQLESITCEASGLRSESGEPLLKLALLRVPRDGITGRFFPVKEPADLEALRQSIRVRLEEGWALREGLRPSGASGTELAS